MKTPTLVKLCCCGIIFFFASCSDYPNLIYQPDIFSPLAKGQTTLEDVIASSKLNFNFIANLPVIVPVGSAPVPAFGPVNSNAKTLDFNTPVVSVVVDTLKITGTLSNPMPVPISAGAELVFRKPNDPTPIFKFTITQSLPANGVIAFSFTQTNITLTPQFTCTIEKISSPGSSTPVNFNGQNARLELSLNIELVKLTSITIQNNVSDYTESTSDFELGIDNSFDATGKLILNIENSFPVDLAVQSYFLDASEKVIDSLFITPVIIQSGTPQNPKKASATNSIDRILKALKPTRYLRVRTYYSTKGSASDVTVTQNSKVAYQLTGDLKLAVKPQ